VPAGVVAIGAGPGEHVIDTVRARPQGAWEDDTAADGTGGTAPGVASAV
jgi:hypothetical protein